MKVFLHIVRIFKGHTIAVIFITCLLNLGPMLAHAQNHTEDQFDWVLSYRNLSNDIRRLDLTPYNDAILQLRKRINSETGIKKIEYAFYLAHMGSILEGEGFEDDINDFLEIAQRKESRYQFHAEIIAHWPINTVASAEELERMGTKFTSYLTDTRLDAGQKLYVLTNLYYVYSNQEKSHLYTEIERVGNELIKESKGQFPTEKMIYHLATSKMFTEPVDVYKASERYFESAKQVDLPVSSAIILHNATVILLQHKFYTDADHLNETLYEIEQKSEYKDAIFVPCYTCMRISNGAGNFKKAQDCARNAKIHLQKWPILKYRFYLEAAITEANLGNTDEAMKYVNTITEADISWVNSLDLLRLGQVKALIYKESKKFEESANSYRDYAEKLEENYKTRLEVAEKELRNLAYQETKSLKEFNLILEEKSNIQYASNQRLRSFLWIMVLIALIAAGLSILLGRQFRVKQKLNADLEISNLALSESLHERELLLQEIHHRIKNNLQLIISLLNLQGRRVDSGDEIPESNKRNGRRVIREIQSRVHTMSLIHKELYRSENYNSVNVSQLIRNLAAYIISLFGEKTDLNLDLENIILEFDKAMPIGLIACEILSNCLEHGRAIQTDARISISLHKTNDRISLKISDNGPGFAASKSKDSNNSLGFLLVGDLCEQIDGDFSYYDCKKVGGACFEVSIPVI